MLARRALRAHSAVATASAAAVSGRPRQDSLPSNCSGTVQACMDSRRAWLPPKREGPPPNSAGGLFAVLLVGGPLPGMHAPRGIQIWHRAVPIPFRRLVSLACIMYAHATSAAADRDGLPSCARIRAVGIPVNVADADAAVEVWEILPLWSSFPWHNPSRHHWGWEVQMRVIPKAIVTAAVRIAPTDASIGRAVQALSPRASRQVP